MILLLSLVITGILQAIKVDKILSHTWFDLDDSIKFSVFLSLLLEGVICAIYAVLRVVNNIRVSQIPT